MTADIQTKASSILSAAEAQGIEIRLIGALSIKLHCDRSKELFDRPISDIDIVSYPKDRDKIMKLLKGLGCQPAQMFNYVNPDRLLFFDSNRTRIDVFLGKFRMCHDFDFSDRIPLDKPTLPPADLLVTKLQIVELNEKDLRDMISLLRDHELCRDDARKDSVNIAYIADLCRKDWGIYRTFTGNISRLLQFLSTTALDNDEKKAVEAKLEVLQKSIEEAPKTIGWKVRARVGEKRVWYNLPETRILGETG